jgi:hypothetical protein
MQSHEVLKRAAENVGVKALASELRLSPALVYKWCQESTRDDPGASGARNPLDRLADVVRVTNSRDVVQWLCHEAGGFFVSNPRPIEKPVRVELLRDTQNLMTEFSLLLQTVTGSIVDDGLIDGPEADKIRQTWEKLKSSAEQFTVACESGAYSECPSPGESKEA